MCATPATNARTHEGFARFLPFCCRWRAVMYLATLQQGDGLSVPDHRDDEFLSPAWQR